MHVTPLPATPSAPRDHGTTHVCVVDADGAMVSLTSTINHVFGARISAAELDVVLNDQIDDFSLPAAGSSFGLAAAAPNALVPGRRPISSMSPTIVLRDGHPVACVGASGGPRIPTAVTQVLWHLLVDGLDPEAAVASPRVHFQGAPDILRVETDVPEDVRAALRARGYTVAEAGPEDIAAAQALVLSQHDGHREILAASDPRKGGVPAGD
jgi:gamma-glutamyltranspeptidase